MDEKTYINILKNTDLRPGKIKLEKFKPTILYEQESMHDIHSRIIDWFRSNPDPKDSQIRDLAKQWNMNEDELEEHIYMILTTMLKKLGMMESKQLTEIFIQQGEINAMEPGVERDKQILRLAIIAELDASNLYEQFAQLTDNDDIATVMIDVSKEEKTHAGEFQALLNSIDSENQEELEAGEEEIEDLLKKDF